jgi:hypothetical protein
MKTKDAIKSNPNLTPCCNTTSNEQEGERAGKNKWPAKYSHAYNQTTALNWVKNAS